MKPGTMAGMIGAVITTVTVIALAQTNSPTGPDTAPPPAAIGVLVTNYVTAHPDFREVNGHLYNRARSDNWVEFNCEIEVKSRGVLVARTFETKSHSRVSSTLSGGSDMPGGRMGGSGGMAVKTDRWKVYGKEIAIANHPDYKTLADRNDITVLAIRNGVFEYDGHTYELWDYGVPHVVPVVTRVPLATNAAANTNR